MAKLEICTPTVSSTLIDRITLNTPFFGLIFYYSQWIFLVSFSLGFLISLFKSPNHHQHHHLDEEDQDIHQQDDEQAGLLDGRHSS